MHAEWWVVREGKGFRAHAQGVYDDGCKLPVKASYQHLAYEAAKFVARDLKRMLVLREGEVR